MDNKEKFEALFSNIIRQNELLFMWEDEHRKNRFNIYRIKRKREKFIELTEKCIDKFDIDIDFMVAFSKFFNRISSGLDVLKLYKPKNGYIYKCESTSEEDGKGYNAVCLALSYTDNYEFIYFTFFDNSIEVDHNMNSTDDNDASMCFKTISYDSKDFINYELRIKKAIKKIVKYYIYGVNEYHKEK